jgi:transposase
VTDNRDFDQILDICLDRLRTGATLADCLASYPQHAAQLAPLLQVAGLLETPAGPTMSDQGLRAGEARLLAQAARLRARRKANSLPLAGLVRRLAAAGIAGAVLVCGMLGVGTVSAASLPDSPLYPVKQATEAVVTWAAFTPQLQTAVHLAWADRRLAEAEALLARDGTADPAVLAALERETEQALAAAGQSGPEQLAAVAAQTEHQQAVLQAVLDKAPAAGRPGLERALTVSANGHTRAEAALDKAKRGKATEEHPKNTPPGQAAPGKATEELPSSTPPGQAAPDKPAKEPPGQATGERPRNTPPGKLTEESPTASAQPPLGTPAGEAETPAATPSAKPTKEHPANTPPGQDKKLSTPTAPSAVDTVEPTPTDVVETPAPATDNNNGQGNDDKEEKVKKDKKDKKEK